MEILQLTDENIYPDENVLKEALGRSYNSYLALLSLFEENNLVHEWRYYRDGKAWLCKVMFKKKTIIWMSAWHGLMKAAIYLPDRLGDDLFNLKITEETKTRIKETKKVGNSLVCTFQIRNLKALKDLEQVMKFKMVAK